MDGPPRPPPPPFPFPDQEDEYDEAPLGEHPLDLNPETRSVLRVWEMAMTKWEDEWDRQYASEENLRKCPLCRK